MTYQEIKQATGNVYKVRHGKRTAYYAVRPDDLTLMGGEHGFLAYEVDKKGFPRRSKHGKIHEYHLDVEQIIEVLPIRATDWMENSTRVTWSIEGWQPLPPSV